MEPNSSTVKFNGTSIVLYLLHILLQAVLFSKVTARVPQGELEGSYRWFD